MRRYLGSRLLELTAAVSSSTTSVASRQVACTPAGVWEVALARRLGVTAAATEAPAGFRYYGHLAAAVMERQGVAGSLRQQHGSRAIMGALMARAAGANAPGEAGRGGQLLLAARRHFSTQVPDCPEARQAQSARNLAMGLAGTFLLLTGLTFGDKALALVKNQAGSSSSSGRYRSSSTSEDDDDSTSEGADEDDATPSSRRVVRRAASSSSGSWSDKLELQAAFAIQQWLSAPAYVKIVTLLVSALPVTAVLGAAYSLAANRGPFVGFSKVYALLLRMPGPIITDEPSAAAAMVASITFVASVFGVAVVFGVVGDDVRAKLTAFREGNLPVIQKGHVLILNANKHLVPLLHQVTMARRKRLGDTLFDRPVVVLSGDSKRDMDALLSKELGHDVAGEIVARQGHPFLLQDLDRVSASHAHTIIVLHPDDMPAAEAAHSKLATLMALQAMLEHDAGGAGATAADDDDIRGALPRLNVVVQTPSDDVQAKEEVAKLAMIDASCRRQGMDVVYFGGTSNVARIMAQASVQPGLSDVYGHIAEPSEDSVRFSVGLFPDLAGLKYGEARRRFQGCVPIGVVNNQHKTSINPPDSLVLAPGDRILALARGDEFRLSAQGAMDYTGSEVALLHQLRGAVQGKSKAKQIVVLGWDGNASNLAQGIAEFSPPGTNVIFMGPRRPEGLQGKINSCRFKYHPGTLTSTADYQAAGVQNADAIIIGGFRGLTDKQSDAAVLSMVTQLQDYLCNLPGKVGTTHVVTMLHNPDTAQTAQYIVRSLGRSCMTLEVLYPRELVGGLLSQVAVEPDLASPIRELIETEEGMEIYIRPPSMYNLDPNQPTPWAAVTELARMRKETAIGYVTASGSVRLTPHAKSQHIYSRDARIISISED